MLVAALVGTVGGLHANWLCVLVTVIWPVTRIVRVLCRDSVVIVYRADNPRSPDESVVVVTPLMSWN